MTRRSLLLLYPARIDVAIELDPLIDAMREVGFIGMPLGELTPNRHFLAGEGFLDHISFLGCSPSFCLDPAVEGFCHIEVGRSPGLAQLFLGPGPLHPRCPRCRYRISEPTKLAQQLGIDPHAPWTCPECGNEHELAALDWRHQVAVAELWVMVWGIEPELAVPGERLLATLAEVTGGPWDYSYALI